jgi:hypothetical protein
MFVSCMRTGHPAAAAAIADIRRRDPEAPSLRPSPLAISRPAVYAVTRPRSAGGAKKGLSAVQRLQPVHSHSSPWGLSMYAGCADQARSSAGGGVTLARPSRPWDHIRVSAWARTMVVPSTTVAPCDVGPWTSTERAVSPRPFASFRSRPAPSTPALSLPPVPSAAGGRSDEMSRPPPRTSDSPPSRPGAFTPAAWPGIRLLAVGGRTATGSAPPPPPGGRRSPRRPI